MSQRTRPATRPSVLLPRSGEPIRVLCVEDDAVVRAYLHARLAIERDFLVCGLVASAGQALAFVKEQPVDLMLLDYELGGADGMQLLHALKRVPREWGHALRVVFCSGFVDPAFAMKAWTVGADGVIAKTQMAAELLPALRSVAGGGKWFPNGVHRGAAATSPEA